MPNARTVEQLKALLEKGDAAACVDFFTGADENERRSFAKLAEDRMRELSKKRIEETAPGTFQLNRLIPAASVAVLATCSLSTCKRFGWLIFPNGPDLQRVITDRRPKWLDDYAEFLLDQDNPAWLTVRAMMKE